MTPPPASSKSASTALPRSFRLIRLELAREPGFPAGSAEHGYRIVAPLDPQGRIDPDEWKRHREACRVVRFRPDEDDDIGHLVRKRGGSWAFHYDVRGDEEDEAGYRFEDEHFVIGEYLSIKEEDGLRTFKVTSVEHV